MLATVTADDIQRYYNGLKVKRVTLSNIHILSSFFLIE